MVVNHIGLEYVTTFIRELRVSLHAVGQVGLASNLISAGVLGTMRRRAWFCLTMSTTFWVWGRG